MSSLSTRLEDFDIGNSHYKSLFQLYYLHDLIIVVVCVNILKKNWKAGLNGTTYQFLNLHFKKK